MKQFICIAALTFVSCNNATESASLETKDTTATTTQTTSPANTPTNNAGTLAGCYLAVQGRDTIRLQLQVQDSTVTGQMQYDNFEIDGNNGSIQGVLRNGRISGYFTFLAEGMWSVREVIFEERAGQLMQASTDKMDFKGDTARFNHNFSFDEQRPFKRVACSQLQLPQLPPQNL